MIIYNMRSCPFTDTSTEDERERVFQKSLYQGTGVKILHTTTTHYSSEAVLLLFCLTVSMLILPLILPPLPPPPYMLLLLPIAILGVLFLLAMAPSNAREVTYVYV